MFAIITHRVNSFDKRRIMPATEDPRTFLIPISFVFNSAIKEVIPKSPRQAINIASIEKTNETGNIFGMGGSIPEDLDAQIPLKEKHNSLMRDMHDQIEQLNGATSGQQEEFESLLKSFAGVSYSKTESNMYLSKEQLSFKSMNYL